VPTDSFARAGTQLFTFTLYDTICSIIICHDSRHPELVRLPVLKGAKIIFYLSFETYHDDGPVPRTEEALGCYRAQVQARAVENRVWVVHGNVAGTGDEATLSEGSHGCGRIVGPDGVVRAEAGTERKQGLNENTREKCFVDFVKCEIDPDLATALYAKESVQDGFFLAGWWRNGVEKFVQDFDEKCANVVVDNFVEDDLFPNLHACTRVGFKIWVDKKLDKFLQC